MSSKGKEEIKKSSSCTREIYQPLIRPTRYNDNMQADQFRGTLSSSYTLATGYGSIEGEAPDDLDDENDESDNSGNLSRDDGFQDDNNGQDLLEEEDEDETEPTANSGIVKERNLSKKKKRTIIRGSSAILANARKTPTMRSHQRKNKKIPGSVRKRMHFC